jgi:uncharacterized protein
MELINDFTVDVPVDQAWEVLTDLERVAPCMPGAELRDIEGEDYHGVVKVKVGPITAEYRGKVTFVERDEGARRAVLRAQGREVRGQGLANAKITATLEGADASTRVSVVTDLNITGKVAQFGRGVLADVSNKLMAEFVESLEASLQPSTAAPGEAAAEGLPPDVGDGKVTLAVQGPGSGPTGDGVTGDRPEAERGEPAELGERARPGEPGGPAGPPEAVPVDLVRVAGPPLLKRAVPALALLALVGLWFLLRRRRRPRS